MDALMTVSAPAARATPEAPPLRMSHDEFMAWEHTGIAEWVNGEVFQKAVKNEHQRVLDFLIQLIGFFIRVMKLGVLRSAPFVMKWLPDGPAREPDLMFVTAEHAHRITRNQLDGPADLVVEIVSDESVVRDRVEKFDEYEAAGVREYWILDPRPRRLRADFFVCDGNGHFRAVPADDGNIYCSTILPGFWLNLNWLWQEDPDPVRALVEIVGTAKLIAAMQ